jgi:glycosyltransferase involved in cell wall biosynthesis
MKVAYINCLLSRRGMLGVEKKLGEQAKAISILGLDLDIFYFNFRRQLNDTRIQYHQYAPGIGNRVLASVRRYAYIQSHVDVDKYDLLVLRYSRGDFSLYSKFFKQNAGKIVTEHHTKELPEAYTYESIVPQKGLTILMERFLSPQIIRKCCGLIGLTDEIKEYELKRAGISLPGCAIPNGILVRNIPFSGSAPYHGDVLNLLFLANQFETWQGLDRVMKGLQKYSSGKPFLHLTVVGNVPRALIALSSQSCGNLRFKVDFAGRLYGHKLEEIYKRTHIAISSLALFRKGMQEACALKTREYIARGLPFVIGHRDPDLVDADGFFLSVPADSEPVHMDEVVTFSERVLTRKGLCGYMREYAEERLDWKIKMQKMWDFLKTITH